MTKSHRYEPEINASFEDFASYYSMTVIPARAYKPRDKALVEGAVKIVYSRVFAKLRHLEFSSLEEINAALWQELEELNTALFQGRSYSRRQLFDEIERDELARLPRLPYELRSETRATVMKNGHVALSADRHYYTVPYQHIGCKVKVMYSSRTVDIYHQHECIASHTRSRRPYGYTTSPEHLASTHRAFSEWSADMFLGRAKDIGPSVHLYIQRIFELRQHPEQAFRTCLGILSFAKRVGTQRLESACNRALDYGSYSYQTIKSILEKNLDASSPGEDDTSGTMPDHDNIRGTDYYNRFDPEPDSDSGEEDALV